MAGKNTVEIILSAKDEASKALREAFGSVNEQNNKFLGGLVSAKSLIAGAFGALGGYLAKTGVDYDTMMEQSQVAWTTLLGSQEKAKQQLMDIANFAKSTPFETEQVDTMAKYMFNAGFAGKQLFDELMKISDTASAFNIPADSAMELSRQMSQVVQAGVAYTQDLNILQDRGVPIYKAIAKELGITTAQVKQMASNGKLTADVYMKAFNDVAKSVKGASDAQSQTFGGMISTFKDDLGILSGALSKPLFDGLKKGMDLLLPTMDALTYLTKGDLKSFADGINQTFGPAVGNTIKSFVEGYSNGFSTMQNKTQTIAAWLGNAVYEIQDFFGKVPGYVKSFVTAIVDFLKGDWLGGVTILTKMGLDTKQVVMIDHAFTDIRNYAMGFVKGVQTTFNNLFSGKNNLGTTFTSIFNTIKGVALPILGDVVAIAKDAFTKLADFWNKNGATIIENIKQSIKDVSDVLSALKPVLNVIFTVITTVGIKVFNDFVDVVKDIGNNMRWITPILIGVGTAIGAYKIISGIIDLYKSWNAITKIMTATQAALDIVLNANPLGLIVTAIGLVVAAGILLYENWDYVKKKAVDLWNSMGNFKLVILALTGPIGGLIAAGVALYQNWDTVKNKMAVVWMEIKGSAVDAINTIIDKINGMIGVINRIPGVSIPIVPKISQAVVLGTPAPGTAQSGNGRIGGRASTSYATGTDNHPGGYALVGENGPEVVNLPQGTQVFDANKSKKMMGQKTNIYNLKVINNQNMDEQTLIRYFQRMEALNHG